MNSFKTHLTILEITATRFATNAAFKIAQPDSHTGRVKDWKSITYREFQQDVELFAKYWARVFKAQNIPEKSVIGLWLEGTTYIDVLQIYGVSRAGYIPQLFSLRLPSPEVIFELMGKANAKALIYDSSCQSILNESPFSIFFAVNAKEAEEVDEQLPDLSKVLDGEDVAFLLHTSGSTSGVPKLVPWTYSWLDDTINKATEFVQGACPPGRSYISSWTGNMCHAGQNFMLLGLIPNAGCIVQPTAVNFSDEISEDMVERCGLISMIQMGSYFSERLRRARQDPKLLSLLQGLIDVGYGGLPIDEDLEEWAHQNGIVPKVIFSSTECGIMLTSDVPGGVPPGLLRPVHGVSYDFRPLVLEDKSEINGSDSGPILLELIVLSDSPNCPHPSLRHPDGHFHTGDLFEEINPGQYASRGRQDDWIKAENALRCDTKAIEHNVKVTCGHLIAECIVVGYGRPSPTLFVEPAVDKDFEGLKREIIQATRPFNSRRYFHEQITSEKMIVVVPTGTLPRTSSKGNIRRKAVEEAFKPLLDKIYAV